MYTGSQIYKRMAPRWPTNHCKSLPILSCNLAPGFWHCKRWVLSSSVPADLSPNFQLWSWVPSLNSVFNHGSKQLIQSNLFFDFLLVARRFEAIFLPILFGFLPGVCLFFQAPTRWTLCGPTRFNSPDSKSFTLILSCSNPTTWPFWSLSFLVPEIIRTSFSMFG